MSQRLVVVGTSLGGLAALRCLLSGLPADYPYPLAIVQHRSTTSGRALAATLQRQCDLPIREPNDKEEIRPGMVYLAPPGYHLLVEDGAFALSTDAPVSYARPSIDVLFESAADAVGDRVVAIVLTGANHDGARGAGAVKRAGGAVIVEDPETAESPIMPRAALAAVQPDAVLPLEEIAPYLTRLSR